MNLREMGVTVLHKTGKRLMLCNECGLVSSFFENPPPSRIHMGDLRSFYLRRSRQIRERKVLLLLFLLLLLLLGGIFQVPMNSFLGCEKAKTLSQKGCEKTKTLS